MVTESIPEVVAEHVWQRHRSGHSAQEVSAWLARIGYTVAADEVPVIAYEQECAAYRPPSR